MSASICARAFCSSRHGATYHAVHEVGLDEMAVDDLIPASCRNLDAGLRGRVHQAQLGLDVSLLLIVVENMPASGLSARSSRTYGDETYQALRCALVVQVLLEVVVWRGTTAGEATQTSSSARTAAVAAAVRTIFERVWLRCKNQKISALFLVGDAYDLKSVIKRMSSHDQGTNVDQSERGNESQKKL